MTLALSFARETPSNPILSGMFVLPYSPRWLAKQGREEEAKATLIRLHGGAHNARHEVVEAEFAEMLTQIEWGEWGVSLHTLHHLVRHFVLSCVSQQLLARRYDILRDNTLQGTLLARDSDPTSC
jgi:hypothetical protein